MSGMLINLIIQIISGAVGGNVAAGAAKNIDLFVEAVGRHKHAHGLADSLGCVITENTLGTSIPGGDVAIEGFADDGVVGRLDDRGETSSCAIGSLVGQGEMAACSVQLFD